MKWFLNIADNRKIGSVADVLRKKRFQLLLSLVHRLAKPVRILDVGGEESYWKNMGFEGDPEIKVVLLNLSDVKTTLPGFESVVGNATDMSEMSDEEFDVVYSNSVIEHLCDWASQKKMATEVQRVGKRYFIQTPNRFFPIEPHYHLPYFQFLPNSLKVQFLKHFELGWRPRALDNAEAEKSAREIRLLTKSEMRLLFPGATIYEERFLGLTKSFVAMNGWDGLAW